MKLAQKLFVLLGAILGVVPVQLGSIIAGKPKFSVVSFGVIMALCWFGIDCYFLSTNAVQSWLKRYGKGHEDTTGSTANKDTTTLSSPSNISNATGYQTMTDSYASGFYGASILGVHLAILATALLNGPSFQKLFEVQAEVADSSYAGAKLCWMDRVALGDSITQLVFYTACGGCAAWLSASFLYTLGESTLLEVLWLGEVYMASLYPSYFMWNIAGTVGAALICLRIRIQRISHAPNIKVQRHPALVEAANDLEIQRIHRSFRAIDQLCHKLSTSTGTVLALEFSGHIVSAIFLSYLLITILSKSRGGWEELLGDRVHGFFLALNYAGVVLTLRGFMILITHLGCHRVTDEDYLTREAVRDLYVSDLNPLLLQHGTDAHDGEDNSSAFKIVSNKGVKPLEKRAIAKLSPGSRELLSDILERKELVLNASGYFDLTKGNLTAILNVVLTYLIIMVQFQQDDSKQ